MKAHLGNQPVQVLEKSKNLFNVNRTLGTISSTTNIPFDESKYYIGLSGSNYLNPTRVKDVSISNESVSITSTMTGYGVCFPIKCLPNTTYTISEVIQNGAEQRYYNTSVGLYTADGNFIRQSSSTTIVTPDNCYWFTVCYHPYTTINVENTVIVSNIMLVQGTTATEYVPYIRRFNFHSPVNLIKMPYDNGLSNTTNGITFTVDEKTGWVTANGTSTGLASFYMKDRSWSMVANESVVRGKFLLKGCPPGGNYTNTYFITVSFSNVDDKRIYLYSHQTNGVLEVGDGRKYTQAYVTIRPNVTVNNLVFKPELIKLLGD